MHVVLGEKQAEAGGTFSSAVRRRPLLLCSLLLAAVMLAFTVLAASPIGQARAAWPGTNGKVFFSSFRDGNVELYSMNPDGSSQTRLTRTTGDEFSPSVSANGRWIAFVYLPNPAAEPDQRIRIEIMRVDGSDRRRVTGSTTVADFTPAFSPGGSTLVFSRETDPAVENSRLWTIEVNGRGAKQLNAIAPFRQFDPQYTADGSRIVFAQETPIVGLRVFSVRPDGSDPQPISPAGRFSSQEPTPSPDGKRVAYRTFENDVAEHPMIESVGIDGDLPQTVVPATNPNIVEYPSWSPDGSSIAFDRFDTDDPDGASQIFRVSPEGGQLTDLTGPSTTANFEPFWAPEPVGPSLRVLRKPRRTTASRRAAFRFRATPGTTLRCKLDRRKRRSCPTNRRVTFRKLRRGKHQLRVTPVATDPTARALGLPSRLSGKVRILRWRVR